MLSPQFVEPFQSPFPVETRRLPLPGSTTTPPRPQIAEPDSSQEDGSIKPSRSLQSALKTLTRRPESARIATTCPWYGGASPK